MSEFPRLALLVPDVRFNSDTIINPRVSAASLPVPGDPVPLVSSFATLELTGAQQYDEAPTINVSAGGDPDSDAQVYYTPDGGTEKGWNEPSIITDVDLLTSGTLGLDTLTLKDGRGAIVQTAAAGITCVLVDGLTRSISATSTATPTNVAAAQFSNGQVLIIGYDGGYLHTWLWDIDAGTINPHAERVITLASNEAMSMAMVDDVPVMVVAVPNGTATEHYLQQYVSTDTGVSFDLVEDWATISTPVPSATPTIVSYRGGLVLGWNDRTTTTCFYAYSGDPLAPLSSAPSGQIGSSSGIVEALGPVILVEENDAFITFIYNLHGNYDYLMAARPVSPEPSDWIAAASSVMPDVEYRVAYSGAATVFYGGDYNGGSASPPLLSSYTVRQARGFFSNGQGYLVAWANQGMASSSLTPLLLFMGGWSTYPVHRNYTNGDEANSGRYSQGFGGDSAVMARTLIASDAVLLPTDAGWTLANTAATALGSVWRWALAQGSYSQTLVPAVTNSSHVYVEWRVDVANGSTGADAVALRVALYGSTFGFDLSIRLTSTLVVVWDNIAGAASATVTRTGDYFIFQGDQDSWRLYNGTGALDSSLILTAVVGANAGAGLYIEWGQAGTNTGISSWSFVNFTCYEGATDIGPRGRRVSTRAVGLGADGLLVSAQAGPLTLADQWSAEPRFLKGPDNADLLKNASPNIVFLGGTGEIVFEPAGGVSTIISKGAYGIYLSNTNIKSAQWRRLQGGDWALTATIQPVLLSGVSYTRVGDFVTPTAAAGVDGGRWLDRMELENCWVDFGFGREAKIVWSSEGVWKTGAAAHANASFRIDEIPPGASTTGTMDIYYHSALLVVNNETAGATRYKLNTITHFGDALQIGGILVGQIVHMSPKNSRGRVVDTDPNTSSTTSRSGATWVRKDGPARRRLKVAWTDGMDLSCLYDGDVDPPTMTAGSAGTNVVGSEGAAKSILEGLIYELSGGYVPIVAVPALAELTTGTSQVYVGRKETIYGRLATGITTSAIPSVKQVEGQTPVVRVNQIEIVEEV